MYANYDTVKGLCINRISTLAQSSVEAAAAVVEPDIDARIATKFQWPEDQNGNVLNDPPPTQIVAIANLLVAAFIEKQSFSQNENGQSFPNPLGSSYEKRANRMLDDLLEGDAFIDGLTIAAPGVVMSPPAQDRSFRTVSGFSGRRHSRR